MTRPTDDITPYKPFGGPLTILQLLTLIGIAGLAATYAIYCFFA